MKASKLGCATLPPKSSSGMSSALLTRRPNKAHVPQHLSANSHCAVLRLGRRLPPRIIPEYLLEVREGKPGRLSLRVDSIQSLLDGGVEHVDALEGHLQLVAHHLHVRRRYVLDGGSCLDLGLVRRKQRDGLLPDLVLEVLSLG